MTNDTQARCMTSASAWGASGPPSAIEHPGRPRLSKTNPSSIAWAAPSRRRGLRQRNSYTYVGAAASVRLSAKRVSGPRSSRSDMISPSTSPGSASGRRDRWARTIRRRHPGGDPGERQRRPAHLAQRAGRHEPQPVLLARRADQDRDAAAGARDQRRRADRAAPRRLRSRVRRSAHRRAVIRPQRSPSARRTRTAGWMRVEAVTRRGHPEPLGDRASSCGRPSSASERRAVRSAGSPDRTAQPHAGRASRAVRVLAPAECPIAVTRAGSPPNAVDLASHPSQRRRLVENAEVLRHAVEHREPLLAEAVLDRDEDDAVPRERAAVVRRGARPTRASAHRRARRRARAAARRPADRRASRR